MIDRIEIETHSDGTNLVRNRGEIQRAVQFYAGKTFKLIFEPIKKKRSNEQNGWYWGVAIPMIRTRLLELGNRFSKDVTHKKLKEWISQEAPDVMLEETVLSDSGVVLKSVKSTAQLTTTDFNLYKEAVQQWAAEMLDINIPDPEKQLTIE